MGICKKVEYLDGTWTYNDMIGSTMRLKSMPCGNYFSFLGGAAEQDLTLEEVYFKVSRDGKVFPVFKMKEFPDKLFTPRDLEVISVNPCAWVPAICGEFICGQTLCGYDVSSEGSFENKVDGLSLVDENGNIIKDRYIRILESSTEDVTTDEDQITDIDINIKGNVLD